MLREVGKRDRQALEGFLLLRYRAMPRIMVRCAIEKFQERLRQMTTFFFVQPITQYRY